MKSKPAPRCHHVSTSGIQCGSPALGKLRYCYYHQQGRSTAIQYYSEMPYTAIEEDLPLFEDAHSIQIAIRQIASLLIQRKIEHKAAGLLLYSIQLALLNLKQLKAEKPHPAQLVVEVEKVEETLPESAFVQAAPPETDSEPPRKQPQSEGQQKKDEEPTPEEVQEQLEYLLCVGRHLNDPGGTVPEEAEYYRVTRALREGELGDMKGLMRAVPKEKLPEAIKERAQAKSQTKSDDGLPPGTIQGCATRRPQSERQPERRNVN